MTASAAALGALAAVLGMTGCAKPDPFDDADYAAACHGPPVHSLEERQKAQEDDPRDGRRHAALVWITGGDSNSLDNFWTRGAPDNDQSASACREAGLILMFPTQRHVEDYPAGIFSGAVR
jgi:hypothetical protein